MKLLYLFYRVLYHFLWISEQFFGFKKLSWSKVRNLFFDKKIYPQLKAKNKFLNISECNEKYLTTELLLNLPHDKPLLFKGILNNVKCVKEWNWEILKEQMAEIEQPYTDTFSSNSFNSGVGNSKLIIENILSDSPQYSIMFGDILTKNKKLYEDMELAKWIDFSKFNFKLNKSWKFFAAGEGRNTNLHCELGNGLIMQVVGEKRWIIFSPKYSINVSPKINWKMYIESEKYQDFSKVENNEIGIVAYEVVLKPGDVLYCPAYFWHFVTNKTAAVSISYKWTNVSSFFRHPFLTACVLSSRYPSSLFRLPFLKKFSIIHPPVG